MGSDRWRSGECTEPVVTSSLTHHRAQNCSAGPFVEPSWRIKVCFYVLSLFLSSELKPVLDQRSRQSHLLSPPTTAQRRWSCCRNTRRSNTTAGGACQDLSPAADAGVWKRSGGDIRTSEVRFKEALMIPRQDDWT